MQISLIASALTYKRLKRAKAIPCPPHKSTGKSLGETSAFGYGRRRFTLSNWRLNVRFHLVGTMANAQIVLSDTVLWFADFPIFRI